MKPTFQHTVSVLVAAYMNDTLAHASCYACAVGNMIAAAFDYKIIKEVRYCSTTMPYTTHRWRDKRGKGHYPNWAEVFSTCCITWKQGIHLDELKGPAQEEIEATGYRWDELAMIEFAFETADKGITDDDWMFNGLMSCVEVLGEIHGMNLDEVEDAKKLFVKV